MMEDSGSTPNSAHGDLDDLHKFSMMLCRHNLFRQLSMRKGRHNLPPFFRPSVMRSVEFSQMTITGKIQEFRIRESMIEQPKPNEARDA